MISLVFKHGNEVTSQDGNVIAGDYEMPGYSMKVSSVAFDWLTSTFRTFIKGSDDLGEFGYVRVQSSPQLIKVYNSGHFSSQWASYPAFDLLKDELGSSYVPYNPIDQKVNVLIEM